ncbi:MAG: hypothetical protein KAR83_07025 [Thermodesulfovibrionales bacterium]|nr:hypothetical protein [Thermodesulfovibrionales bacterium]
MKPLTAGIAAVALVFIASAAAYAQTETGNAYTYKIAVERHLEERLNKVLKDVIKIDDLVIMVSAEVISEGQDLPGKPGSKRRQLLLPGVPTKDRLGDATSAGVKSTVVVQSLLVTVLVDKSTSQSTIDSIHDITLSALDFDPDRGDRIEIRKVDFLSNTYQWGTLLLPQNLIVIVLGVIGAVFLGAAAMFFMNPFKSLAVSIKEIDWPTIRGTDASDILKTLNRSQTGEGPSPGGSGNDGAASVPHATEATSTGRFGFITGNNIAGAGFLLEEAPVEDLAIVLGYLTPELASTLLGMFPVKNQAEAVALLSGTQKLDLEKVERLESSLREQMDLVVGGEARLAAILDLADDDMRDRTIADIERKDLNAAIRLRGKAMGLDSIISSLESNDIKKLVRKFDLATFARILNSSPGDVQAKVLESLGGGGAERLSEEMKYAGTFPVERLKREKRKVIAKYRELQAAGEILERNSDGMEV